MITIDKLKKNFGEKVAVDIEHYEINQGDMLGLVGNNGAGKTTLFRLMLDLLKADDGKVIINDIDVSQSEDWKSITGAFIDDGFLIDYLTPEEYFYFIGKMYGLKKEEVDERLIPFERFMSGEVIGHKKLIRNYSAKSLKLKHTIKLIRELAIEIDEIEAAIKRIMDEEIQSPIFTIPGISYRMGAMIIAEIGDFSRFIPQIRYSHMQECLPPLINPDS